MRAAFKGGRESNVDARIKWGARRKKMLNYIEWMLGACEQIFSTTQDAAGRTQ